MVWAGVEGVGWFVGWGVGHDVWVGGGVVWCGIVQSDWRGGEVDVCGDWR